MSNTTVTTDTTLDVCPPVSDSNALCECGAKKTLRQTRCKACMTRLRVARHRLRMKPVTTLVQDVANDHLRNKRSAVTQCTAGDGLLRDVGRDTAGDRLAEAFAPQQKKEKALVKAWRAESAALRRELVAQKRELTKQIDGLTSTLEAKIVAIREESDDFLKKLKQEILEKQ